MTAQHVAPLRTADLFNRLKAVVSSLRSDRILLSAAGTFAVRVGAAGLAFVVQVLLARVLSLQDYGIYVNLWAWLIIAGYMAVSGFSESVIRFVPRYMERDRISCAKGFLATGFAVVTIASISLAVLALTIIWLNREAIYAPYVLPVTVLAFGLPFATIELYLLGVCRALGWFMLATVPGYIVRPVLIGLSTITATYWGLQPDAGFVLGTAVATTALITLAQCYVIWWRTRAQFAATPAKRKTRLWLRASLPLLVVYGLDELFYWSDIVVLGFLTSPDQLGIYFAAVRCMALASFVHYAFMIVSTREFSIANALQDRGRLQDYVTNSSNWTFWLTIPSVALTLAGSYPLLALFGPVFVSAIPVMFIIGGGLIARAAVGNAADLLVVLGYQRATIAIAFGALTINIVLAILLVPVVGIVGAALSTAVAQSCRSLALSFCVRKLAGLKVCAQGPAALLRRAASLTEQQS